MRQYERSFNAVRKGLRIWLDFICDWSLEKNPDPTFEIKLDPDPTLENNLPSFDRIELDLKFSFGKKVNLTDTIKYYTFGSYQILNTGSRSDLISKPDPAPSKTPRIRNPGLEYVPVSVIFLLKLEPLNWLCH